MDCLRRYHTRDFYVQKGLVALFQSTRYTLDARHCVIQVGTCIWCVIHLSESIGMMVYNLGHCDSVSHRMGKWAVLHNTQFNIVVRSTEGCCPATTIALTCFKYKKCQSRSPDVG